MLFYFSLLTYISSLLFLLLFTFYIFRHSLLIYLPQGRLLADDIISEDVSEQIAEEIDEAIHSLQYKLDHCKRYV